MAKDKAARERAREQKKKEARIRDQKRRETANRMQDTALKALFMGNAAAFATMFSTPSPMKPAVPTPDYYGECLSALAPLKEQVDHLSLTAMHLSQHLQGDELQAWHTVCARFVVKTIQTSRGPDYFLDLQPTLRCAFAAAVDPFEIARVPMLASGGSHCGFVTCVMSAGSAAPVWCVICADGDGRMAAWMVDGVTWLPVSVPELLLRAAAAPADAPLAESEAFSKLLQRFGYSRTLTEGVDFKDAAACQALALTEGMLYWSFERYRTMSSIAEGFMRGGIEVAKRSSQMIADRETDVRKLRGETEKLKKHASMLQARVPIVSPPPAPPGASLAERLADLFAPA